MAEASRGASCKTIRKHLSELDHFYFSNSRLLTADPLRPTAYLSKAERGFRIRNFEFDSFQFRRNLF